MDERLRTRLRVVAAPTEPRPEFVEDLHDDLAARLGLIAARAATIDVERPVAARRPWLLLAATIALALALGGGALIAGAIIDRVSRQPSLLDELRSTGTVRVAVRPDEPQLLVPGGALSGFDIDVARALGERLGLRVELTVASVEQILQPDVRAWDIALPSTSLAADAVPRYDATNPYYHWPFYLLVPAASAVTQPSDLSGEVVCAVAGSAGQAWLSSSGGVALDTLLLPPLNATVLTRTDDSACLAEVADGRAAALVTAGLLEPDLASRPGYRIVGSQVAGYEGRAVIVTLGRSETASLVEALNQAISDLRASGELTRISESRFGGQDLSVPPR